MQCSSLVVVYSDSGWYDNYLYYVMMSIKWGTGVIGNWFTSWWCHNCRAGLHWISKWSSPSPPPMLGLDTGVMILEGLPIPHLLNCSPDGSSGGHSHQCSGRTVWRTHSMTGGFGFTQPWVPHNFLWLNATCIWRTYSFNWLLFTSLMYTGELWGHEEGICFQNIPGALQLFQCKNGIWWRYRTWQLPPVQI